MNNLRKYIYIVGLLVMTTITGCSDADDEITNIEYDTLFSPTELEARVLKGTNIRVLWNAVRDAESYIVELHENGSLNFEGTPVKTAEVSVPANSHLFEFLEGETAYSIRVKAQSNTTPDSKWSTVLAETAAEQIFSVVEEDDLTISSAILRWPAGQSATKIIITPGSITHNVTADEVAAGEATITGLESDTEYTAQLLDGDKVRGNIIFETPIDLAGATAIYPEDDIVEKLDAAVNGDQFIIFQGEYILGEYILTKDITLKGYKASEKPTINGFFKVDDSASIELRNIIFSGTDDAGVPTRSHLITANKSTSTVGDINIISCEITNYKSGLIYDNNGGTFTNIVISDCIVTNLVGDGGDGLDFRGGKLGSLIVENCTFNKGFRAFLRSQGAANVAFRNCTFYKICNFDNSNNSGFFRTGGGTLEVSNCLFVETGVEGKTYGNWCKSSGNMGATPTYSNNYYYSCYNLWEGLYTNPTQCDAKEANPGFLDAENGDFTLFNEDLIFYEIGDARWRRL